MAEAYRQLYEELIETELGCVPPGFHDTEEVYELVEEAYPDLCEDRPVCNEVCEKGSDQPEWKHRVRTAQQSLRRSDGSRIRRLSDGWYYSPTDIGVNEAPAEPEFNVGSKYNRWELHDIFGGQRYRGIATPADHSLIFIFTGESGDDYGYEDEFLPDGRFIYTGEGAEGDMEMDDGNAAIRHHQSNNESVHLFEDTGYPWIVTYVGEFEYVGHQWDTLPDKNGDLRDGIRFRLEPTGGVDVETGGESPETMEMEQLFEKAKESSPGGAGTTQSSSSGGQSYPRSEVVKRYALREADGVCQGCLEEAPFTDESGDPYLEVHHLHRRSDGGPDDPENVIALCANCHRRVHHGEDGDEFNRELIDKKQELVDTRN